MKVKFKKLQSSAVLPSYATAHSAGMDVSACIIDSIILKPMQRKVVPTGLVAEIPIGYEIQVRARSGLAAKSGISLVNGVGTIDADYRGELGIILVNFGTDDFIIKNGDRIAQLVVAKYEKVEIYEAQQVNSSQRGQGGFGSTGK